MPQLSATFTDFIVLREEGVHRADRAEEDALIEQRGVDLRRCLVGEIRRVQHVQDCLPLRGGQRPGWPRPRAGDRRRRGQAGAPALNGGA